MRPRRWKGKCKSTGKIKWRSSMDAALALGSARKGILRPKLEDHHYRCPHCNYWHLTSMANGDKS